MTLILGCLTCSGLEFQAGSTMQPAWTARYRGGSGLRPETNKPVAIALDLYGNVIVAGAGTTATDDYDYLT